MDIRERIHSYFGVSEAYKVPPLLLRAVLDSSQFEELKLLFDGRGDVFADYFEGEQGDRNALKQDFTPMTVAKIVANMIDPSAKVIADVCAGVGRLTLAAHEVHPTAHFYCDEMSERTIPFLLANLAINGVRATVRRCDVLTREVFEAYEVEDGRVVKVDGVTLPTEFDSCIMNPPYSVKWSGVGDERCEAYGIAPKSKADFMFMLDGLARVKTGGNVVAIVPHGVLFRGQSEGKIRQALIERREIQSVIGLPDKLFLNTSIPVCIVELVGGGTADGACLFVDASNEYTKGSKVNTLEPTHIEKVLTVYRTKLEAKRYSTLATMDDMKGNDYNLNIPRYVDTFEPPPAIDILAVLDTIEELHRSIRDTEEELTQLASDLISTSGDEVHSKALERIKGGALIGK